MGSNNNETEHIDGGEMMNPKG
ncbi:hypothetical protein KGM_213763A, partial [Danaus plexippus plexippus]